MSVSAKIKRLLEYIGLDEIPFKYVDHGPFSLFPLGENVFAVCDHPEAFDIWELERQAQQLVPDVPVIIVTGQSLLARIVTAELYSGFHNKMGFAIRWPMFYTEGFMGLKERKPNYRAIQKALEYAGFVYTPPTKNDDLPHAEHRLPAEIAHFNEEEHKRSNVAYWQAQYRKRKNGEQPKG